VADSVVGDDRMSSSPNEVVAILSRQCEHQLRLARQRMTWRIPWIFVLGLAVSILGLVPSVAAFLDDGAPTLTLFVFALSVVFFGWVVILWLTGPFPIRPRIVPYFTRELGKYGGTTMTAFARGRGLYREIVALEQLAGALGVTPLSAFGFAYDHYDQDVHWHAASEGLRTAEALRRNLGAHLVTAPDVARDLEALASVLRAAADRGVDFSLVLRLHAKDSMQAVCTREVRQGSFW
jgi:hypothetical protein